MKNAFHHIISAGRPRTLLALALCAVGLALATATVAGPAKIRQHTFLFNTAVRTADWRDKVDPAVLTAANNGTTEFVIGLTPVADLSGAAALRTKQEKGLFVYQKLTAAAEATQPAVRQILNSLGAEHQDFWVSNVIWARGDAAVLQAVASMSQVAYVVSAGGGGLKLPPQRANRQKAAPAPQSTDAIAAVEGSLLSVNADDVWALGYRGHGVTVAGADTGVRWTHAALKPHYRGWNGTTATHDYNWHDGIHNPNPGCPADSPEPCDDDVLLGGGHGSHTVGTMVGDDGGNNRIGMAPESKWIACRNMNQGVGVPVTGYLECMQFFLAPTKIDGTAPDPSKAPDVINNSWGCVEPGCAPEPNPPLPGFLRATLQASRAAGIFYVVSAGNDGQGGTGDCSTLQFPLARYPESFTVGAIDHRNGQPADFSSRGPVLGDPDFPTGLLKPNISAPGVTIRSVQRDSDTAYGSLSGTSMSGPHVAGLVALIISANPKLAGNVDRIEEIIEQSAMKRTTTQACGGDTATSVPNNVYGWGSIDALAAVNLALAEATPVELVSVASRKNHGSKGAFDLLLPLSDTVGVEPRSGQPATGEHTLVFTFADPIANVSNASVTSGSGFVSGKSIGADPHELIVNLGGVDNAQRVRVALTGVTDQAGNSSPTVEVSVDFLLADVNGSHTTNSGDVLLVQKQNGQALPSDGAADFRRDINLNGAVDSGDVLIAQKNNPKQISP